MGTTTTNYGLKKPTPGAEEITWGVDTNSNMDAIDSQMKINFSMAYSAINAVGFSFYATYAEADADKGNLADNTVVEVYEDETQGGTRTRYRKEVGPTLTFIGTLDDYVNTAGDIMTGVLQLPDGNIAAPSLANSSDVDTGIYFPSVGTIGFVTGGVQRAQINSSGHLLVGTSSTQGYGATIAGSAVSAASGNTAALALLNESDGGVTIKFTNSVGDIGQLALNVDGTGSGTDDSSMYFRVAKDGTLYQVVRLTSDRRMIVGESGTDDGHAMTVSGTAGATSGISVFETSTGNNQRLRIAQYDGYVAYDATAGSGGNYHRWMMGGSDAMLLNTAGNLLLGTTTDTGARFTINSAASPWFIFRNTDNSVAYGRFDDTTNVARGYIGLGSGLTTSGLNTDMVLRGESSVTLNIGATGIARADPNSFRPVVDNSYSSGSASERWSVVYSATGTINTSDVNAKNSIESSSLGLEFVNKLRPVQYKFNVGHIEVNPEDGSKNVIPGKRTHFGLIAQEVKESLPDDLDFAGWVLSNKEDPDSQQGLRYEQFIAPLIKSVQELSQRVSELERLGN